MRLVEKHWFQFFLQSFPTDTKWCKDYLTKKRRAIQVYRYIVQAFFLAKYLFPIVYSLIDFSLTTKDAFTMGLPISK